MRDLFDRPLTDLRVSVTDQCSFRCPPCLPAERFPADYPWLAADRLLTFGQIRAVVTAAVGLGLTKVRLTGGEPLQRPRLADLVEGLKRDHPRLGVYLTTNGAHLGPQVGRLKEAGLDGVTVSLGALSPGGYGAATGTGRRVEPILEAIDEARRAFGSVKVNTVLVRGAQEDEVEALTRRFAAPGYTLRFLEYMAVGTLNGWTAAQVIPGSEVLARVAEARPGHRLTPVAPARPGQTSQEHQWDDGGRVGFVNAVSQPFCGDCGRGRLGPDGRFYPCLFSSRGLDLAPLLAGETPIPALRAALEAFWTRRDDRYSELRAGGQVPDAGPRIEMFGIGG